MATYHVLWCVVFAWASWSFAVFAFGYTVGRTYRSVKKVEPR